MPHLNTLVFDLDHTLICAIETGEDDYIKTDKFPSYDMDGVYTVYSRPFLDEFLTYAFDNFNIIIWTAASKDYALFIIEKIILQNKPERKIDYILFDYHCDLSRKHTKFTKDLRMITDVHNLPYDLDKIIIIDDYKEDVHLCQPSRCIIAPPFDIVNIGSEDEFLKQLTKNLKQLTNSLRDDINTINSNNMMID